MSNSDDHTPLASSSSTNTIGYMYPFEGTPPHQVDAFFSLEQFNRVKDRFESFSLLKQFLARLPAELREAHCNTMLDPAVRQLAYDRQWHTLAPFDLKKSTLKERRSNIDTVIAAWNTEQAQEHSFDCASKPNVHPFSSLYSDGTAREQTPSVGTPQSQELQNDFQKKAYGNCGRPADEQL